jgi:N-methylhydantoinase A
VLSAFGAATADVRRERVASVRGLMPVPAEAIVKALEQVEAGVLEDLAADGVAPADRTVAFEADVRFRRQTFEIPVPLRGIDQLVDDFREEYARRYGRGALVLGTPVELVCVRAIGSGRTPKARLGERDDPRPDATGRGPTPVGVRSVRIDRGPDGRVVVDVHDGAALRPGHRIAGPALVDGTDTTVWVPPGAALHVDRHYTFEVTV